MRSQNTGVTILKKNAAITNALFGLLAKLNNYHKIIFFLGTYTTRKTDPGSFHRHIKVLF